MRPRPFGSWFASGPPRGGHLWAVVVMVGVVCLGLLTGMGRLPARWSLCGVMILVLLGMFLQVRSGAGPAAARVSEVPGRQWPLWAPLVLSMLALLVGHWVLGSLLLGLTGVLFIMSRRLTR
jgi:hypothetical protein